MKIKIGRQVIEVDPGMTIEVTPDGTIKIFTPSMHQSNISISELTVSGMVDDATREIAAITNPFKAEHFI